MQAQGLLMQGQQAILSYIFYILTVHDLMLITFYQQGARPCRAFISAWLTVFICYANLIV